MKSSEEKLPRERQDRALLLIILLAFVLRVVYVLAAGLPDVANGPDAPLYDKLAWRLITEGKYYAEDHLGRISQANRPVLFPFVLGGTCCCTPTQELIDAYHRDGLLLDYDLGRLIQLYEGLGIQTLRDHRDCNNQCSWGPHVIQGGKCMVPPTPGTQHYEEIITGRFSDLASSNCRR